MKKSLVWMLICLILAGCSAQTTPTSTPTETTTPSASPTAEPTMTVQEATVFFILDTPLGLKLVSELRQFKIQKLTLEQQVMSELISGDLQPLDPDYGNLWTASNQLTSVQISGEVAILDIKKPTMSLGAAGEVAALNQLVWTMATLSPSVTSLTLLIEGVRADSLADHVNLTEGFPLRPDFEVLSAIQIESPLNGEDATQPVTVSGKACTFEANVLWSLYLNNQLQTQGSTLAAQACPVRSNWSVNLGTLSPGTYTFMAQEFSAKDGTLVAEDTKEFVVR